MAVAHAARAAQQKQEQQLRMVASQLAAFLQAEATEAGVEAEATEAGVEAEATDKVGGVRQQG